MNPRLIAAGVAGVLALGAVGWMIFGRDAGSGTIGGYVEGDRLYLAAPASGAVSELYVREGARIEAGAPTFLIDPSVLGAQAGSAEAGVAAAEARARDLRQGQRAQELAVIDAELRAAEAQERQADADYARIEPLVRRGIYAPARLDQVRAARDTARAQTAAVRQRREVAELGARDEAVRQAEAQTVQAEGAAAEAGARLNQLSPVSPAAGRVEEIFYDQGEWAPANQPVVAILPDRRVRVVFFVPEETMALYQPGRTVRFGCDGCQPGEAEIVFVSARPEFTPPVLYNRENRNRLVYRVEARPTEPGRLNPGLPVDVEPLGDE